MSCFDYPHALCVHTGTLVEINKQVKPSSFTEEQPPGWCTKPSQVIWEILYTVNATGETLVRIFPA